MTTITLSDRVSETFRIIAHRGASGYAPENTMAAFQLAQKMGAEEIELDVQFSKDQMLMICHDPELSRYGHPGVQVSDLICEELKTLDMGSLELMRRGLEMMNPPKPALTCKYNAFTKTTVCN